jgi:hypothetical protein
LWNIEEGGGKEKILRGEEDERQHSETPNTGIGRRQKRRNGNVIEG